MFSGDRDGAPLVRSGSCPTQAGTLDLSGQWCKKIPPIDCHTAGCNNEWGPPCVLGITSVKTDSFSGMGACLELYLDHNWISVLPAGVFDQLTSLRTLRLENNAISVLPAGIFDKLKVLDLLGLSGNAISVLPAGVFDQLTSLTELKLYLNAISVLPAGSFDRLTSLIWLYLSGNTISVLPAGVFDKLTSLTTLDLRGNAICVLPAGIFDQLTSLGLLQLDGNSIRVLPAGIFDKLKVLGLLGLSGNAISVLPAGIFDQLTSPWPSPYQNEPKYTILYLRCDPAWQGQDALSREDASCPEFPGNSCWYEHQHGHRAYCAAERDNAALACYPLTQERMAALRARQEARSGLWLYYGPADTCEALNISAATTPEVSACATPPTTTPAPTPPSPPTPSSSKPEGLSAAHHAVPAKGLQVFITIVAALLTSKFSGDSC